MNDVVNDDSVKAAVEDVQGDERRPARSRMLLWVLAGVVAAALVIGAVVGVARRPASLVRGSPESVVQAYLQAVIDGEHGQAAGYLSAEAAERCPLSAFREAWVPPSLTADLDDARVRGDEAEVRVRLRSEAGPPPFGDGGFASIETFTLVRESGGWRIAEDPWPLYSCGIRL